MPSSKDYPLPTDHIILLLPFTLSTYQNPTPLLPIIHQTLTHSSLKSLTVIFLTPDATSPDQLYTQLRKNPVKHWHGFQIFLGKVYATLAAAQWACSRVLMDVEIRFEGEDGGWAEKLRKGGSSEFQVISSNGCCPTPSDHLNSFLQHQTITTFPNPPDNSNLDPHQTPNSTPFNPSNPSRPQSSGLPVIALGGTFDHLHAAHKLLLHLALFLSTRKLIVGIMSDKLLGGKSNARIVEGLERRVERVEAFLGRCGAIKSNSSIGASQKGGEGKGKGKEKGMDVDEGEEKQEEGRETGRGKGKRTEVEIGLNIESATKEQKETETEKGQGKGRRRQVEMDVVEIHDPLGPTGWDPDIQGLVVSRETLSGGEMVNRHRREKGLSELELFVIDVISHLDVPLGGRDGSEGKRDEVDVRDEDEDEDVNTIRTLDLAGERDEKRLKELKMGSTAIREWIAKGSGG